MFEATEFLPYSRDVSGRSRKVVPSHEVVGLMLQKRKDRVKAFVEVLYERHPGDNVSSSASALGTA